MICPTLMPLMTLFRVVSVGTCMFYLYVICLSILSDTFNKDIIIISIIIIIIIIIIINYRVLSIL